MNTDFAKYVVSDELSESYKGWFIDIRPADGSNSFGIEVTRAIRRVDGQRRAWILECREKSKDECEDIRKKI